MSDTLRNDLLMTMVGRTIDRTISGKGRIPMHESAHAVAAVVLGIPVALVTVTPCGNSLGHIETGAAPPKIFEADYVFETDRRHTARMAYLMCNDEPGLCRWRSALRFIRDLQKQADAIVGKNWQVIRLFAADLINQVTITGPEATATIRELLEAQANYRAGLPFEVRPRWVRTELI